MGYSAFAILNKGVIPQGKPCTRRLYRIYAIYCHCISADNKIMNSHFPLMIMAFLIAANLYAQTHDAGVYSDTLRGLVWADLMPLEDIPDDGQAPNPGGGLGSAAEPEFQAAGRRALEEAAAHYSAMIYGWTFHYDIGERSRSIPEEFSLTPVNVIPFGDPGLRVSSVETKDMRVILWTDYQMTAIQQRRMQLWQQDSKLTIQGMGYGPTASPFETPSEWHTQKTTALKDAARAALRAALRASERNRPKEVTGYICLASFPRFFISEGRMTAIARFRVEISEILPFAAY